MMASPTKRHRGTLSRPGVLAAVCILCLRTAGTLVAAWDTQIIIVADRSNAEIRVDGQYAGTADEPAAELLGCETGQWCRVLSLDDHKPHTLTVHDGQSRAKGPGLIMAVEDQPVQVAKYLFATPAILPGTDDDKPGPAQPAARFIAWMDRLPESYIVGAAAALTILLAILVGMTLVRRARRRYQREHPPAHVPTIISQGWPYVMWRECHSLNPIAKIGSGGIANVFLVEDRKKREVAVKILHEHLAEDSRLRSRFLAEASILRILSRTGVTPSVMERSQAQFPRPWFAMEYLGGMYRLRDMIGGREFKSLSRDWAIPVMKELCISVSKVHSAGVVHRDLSPENVLYGFSKTMKVRVLDFDSAKTRRKSLSRDEFLKAAEENDDGPNEVIGKINYTSPEQWENFDAADERSDTYSVAAMIWEMFVGRPPFAGGSVDDIRNRHLHGTRDPSILMSAGLPDTVAQGICAALSVKPGGRPTLGDLCDLFGELGDSR
jgi:tRNA A-37 threonylcarbamoyl transferase component Bud32